MDAIKRFFDAVQLIAKRFPALGRLLTEIVKLVLQIIGAYALIKSYLH